MRHERGRVAAAVGNGGEEQGAWRVEACILTTPAIIDLHLSPRGYRIWADSIEPTLWKLLDEPEAGK